MSSANDIFRQESESLDGLEKFRIMVNLHHDIWMEELLGQMFYKEYRLLTPVERQILELRVEGKTNEEAAKLIGCKLHTIRCRVRDIRHKYRTGVRERVDNMPLLRWIKQQRGGK